MNIYSEIFDSRAKCRNAEKIDILGARDPYIPSLRSTFCQNFGDFFQNFNFSDSLREV